MKTANKNTLKQIGLALLALLGFPIFWGWYDGVYSLPVLIILYMAWALSLAVFTGKVLK